MKTVEKLVGAKRDIKAGSHKVIINGDIREFVHYNTVICRVNDAEKTFEVDASWGSVSTTRMCNSYEREFEYLGYTKKG